MAENQIIAGKGRAIRGRFPQPESESSHPAADRNHTLRLHPAREHHRRRLEFNTLNKRRLRVPFWECLNTEFPNH